MVWLRREQWCVAARNGIAFQRSALLSKPFACTAATSVLNIHEQCWWRCKPYIYRHYVAIKRQTLVKSFICAVYLTIWVARRTPFPHLPPSREQCLVVFHSVILNACLDKLYESNQVRTLTTCIQWTRSSDAECRTIYAWDTWATFSN